MDTQQPEYLTEIASTAAALLRRRRALDSPLSPPMRAIPSDLTWEADVAPFPDVSPPGHLAAIALVAAGGVTLQSQHVQVRPRPDAVIATLQNVLELTERHATATPERIIVRDPEIARGLGRRLDLPVDAAECLPSVDETLAAAAEARFGLQPLEALPWVAPDWMSWGLDVETIHQIFAAAAGFYRAAPWRTLGPDQSVAVSFTDKGTTWFARTLGGDGGEIGLCLYEILSDHPTSTLSRDFAPRSGGRAMALTYSHRSDIGEDAWRLIRDNFWPLAGEQAVPRLRTWNTPCGVDRDAAWDLATVLGWLPEVIDVDPEGPPEYWCHSYWATQGVEFVPLGDVARPRRAILDRALAQGPGALPGAALVTHSPGILTADHLDLVTQLAEAFSGQGPDVVRSVSEAVRIFLVDYLAEHVRIPVTAVTDCDLRHFVHEWLPTQRSAWSGSESMFAGLAVLFRGLWPWRQIHCPWATRFLDGLRHVDGRWVGASTGTRPDELQAAAESGDDQRFQELASADLRRRFLVPDWHRATTIPWRQDPGPTEARLRRELCRRWLLWREDYAGTIFVARDEAQAQLLTRQHRWENRVHAVLGRTPKEAVLEEQGHARGARRSGSWDGAGTDSATNEPLYPNSGPRTGWRTST